MTDSLIQPFRRNLDYSPIIIPVGVNGIARQVPPMTGGGVTSFKMCNPNPFWVWFRGWGNATNPKSASDMPTIANVGHYIAPGAVDICRTQMPQWIAAVGAAEPDLPLAPMGTSVATDTDGSIKWNGQRCRLVMIYGSGA